MSIVIATLEENNCVNIFADRRIVVENKEGTYLNIGEIQKIYKLSDTILCGITGDAQWGISLAQELIKYQNRPASELIQIIENFDISFNDHSTFTLGGKYDDGKLFYYGFTTKNRKGGINFASNALIATSPIEYLNSYGDFFLDLKDEGNDNKEAAIQTIKFASLQNPKYISEQYDYIQIKL